MKSCKASNKCYEKVTLVVYEGTARLFWCLHALEHIQQINLVFFRSLGKNVPTEITSTH